MKRILPLFSALLLLSGCAVKDAKTKPFTYTLMPTLKLERFAEHNHDVIKVARIDSTSGLNTRAILYQKDGATLPYKYGTWSETPSLKLQYLIAEALQDQNHFHSVVIGNSMASSNLILEPILQDFEEIFRDNGLSYVLVNLRFRLIESKSGAVLGSIKITSQKEVTNTNGAAGTVEAFNEASAEVIQNLSLWINDVRK